MCSCWARPLKSLACTRWPNIIHGGCPICIRRLPVEKGTSLFWKDILDYRMDASGLVQVRQKMEERKTIVNSYFGSGPDHAVFRA